jgi:uncharacterized protein involved in exopolysaccharide biosynthesis
LESTKIQIAKDTPIFAILDPVTIPSSAKAKKNILFILISVVLGFVLSIGYIIFKELLKGVKEQWD